MSILDSQPWRALPPATASLIAAEIPLLRDEILEVIGQEVPAYARPLQGAFGRGIEQGVEEALRQLVDLVADPGGRTQSGEVYRALGRGEMRAGRSLDALQAAYRIGARVTWLRLARAGLRAQLDAAVLCTLADSIFAYIDELAAHSVEGFAEAQREAAGERGRRRRRLLLVLLGEPLEIEALRKAALEAQWRVPHALSALACHPDDLDAISRRLPDEALAGTIEDEGCIVIPDAAAPGAARIIKAACEGRSAALGPSHSPEHALASWRRARSAMQAIELGALPGGFCVAAEHLAAIAIFQAREPLRELALLRLAPLSELTSSSRARMLATLRAYLDHSGSTPAMAAALELHPQTVRYRMRQLRELFGAALEDPDARFELQAAVRTPPSATASGARAGGEPRPGEPA